MHLKIQNFTTAIRRLSEAHGSQIEANISPDHAIQYANEVDALVKDREKYETLRQAARAMVEALASDHGARPWGCRECGTLATRTGADLSYCDDCDPGGFTGDLSHAPALRALRALLEAP